MYNVLTFSTLKVAELIVGMYDMRRRCDSESLESETLKKRLYCRPTYCQALRWDDCSQRVCAEWMNSSFIERQEEESEPSHLFSSLRQWRTVSTWALKSRQKCNYVVLVGLKVAVVLPNDIPVGM